MNLGTSPVAGFTGRFKASDWVETHIEEHRNHTIVLYANGVRVKRKKYSKIFVPPSFDRVVDSLEKEYNAILDRMVNTVKRQHETS